MYPPYVKTEFLGENLIGKIAQVPGPLAGAAVALALALPLGWRDLRVSPLSKDFAAAWKGGSLIIT